MILKSRHGGFKLTLVAGEASMYLSLENFTVAEFPIPQQLRFGRLVQDHENLLRDHTGQHWSAIDEISK